MGSSERAPAKVNLFLHVTGRREDGYHLLDSLAVFPDAADELHAEPAETLILTLAGPFASALAIEPDNLVLRAARALAEAAGCPPRARLILTKNLPVASGIGGGSADAAAALRVLAAQWGVAADLPVLAARLGADVPVCLASRSARMGGVGEMLAAAPALPPFGMVLLNPGVPIPTAEVFRARTGGFSESANLPSRWTDAVAMAADLARCRNDLEPPAIALCPAIGATLGRLRAVPGCLLARMSGSGATCFALFATPDEAKQTAAVLGSAGHWAWGGGLFAP